MHEALLSEKLSDSLVRCNICQWRCTIQPEKSGVCGMYRNVKCILYNLNYGLASSVAVDPIEKKPLFHFHPGTQVFSLGGWGCNFHHRDFPILAVLTVKIAAPAAQRKYLRPRMKMEQRFFLDWVDRDG